MYYLTRVQSNKFFHTIFPYEPQSRKTTVYRTRGSTICLSHSLGIGQRCTACSVLSLCESSRTAAIATAAAGVAFAKWRSHNQTRKTAATTTTRIPVTTTTTTIELSSARASPPLSVLLLLMLMPLPRPLLSQTGRRRVSAVSFEDYVLILKEGNPTGTTACCCFCCCCRCRRLLLRKGSR